MFYLVGFRNILRPYATPLIQLVAQFSIDPAPGSAFGLAIDASSGRIRFAAVDDGLHVLDLWDE